MLQLNVFTGILGAGQIVGDRVVPYTPDNSLALRQAKENTPNKPLS